MPASDFVSRGQALVASGQYQEAVKICRLGLLAKPTDTAGRLVLGQALLALRRYDEVLGEMRVAIDGEPGNAGAHQLRGEALLRKGDGFGAVDALERARGLAHGDPTIAALLAEARNLVASDAARAPGGEGGDLDADTKHYPTHRGGEAAGSGRPGSLTKPVTVGKAGGERRGTERQSSPSLAHLDIGDSSGTVEVDPEREGLEIDDDELGDVIEPPSAGGSASIIIDDSDLVEVDPDEPSRPGLRARGGAAVAAAVERERAPVRAPERAPVVERAPAPVVPLFGPSTEPGRGVRGRPTGPVSPQPRAAASAPARAPAMAPAPAARPAPPRAEADPGLEQRTTATRTAEWGADEVSSGATRQHRLPVPPIEHGDGPTRPRLLPEPDDPSMEASQPMAPIDPRLPRDARALRGAPVEPYEEESSMVGRGQHPKLAALPSGPLGAINTPPPQLTPSGRFLPVGPGAPIGGDGPPRPDEEPSRSPVLVLPPQARTAVPFNLAAVKPTMMMRTEGAPPPPAEEPRGRGRPTPGPPLAPPPMQHAPPVHGYPPPGHPALSPDEVMRMMGPGPVPARRSPLVLALWATVTVAIIGAGVLAGFKIRELRLDKQIAAARKGAEDAAGSDTWLGWRAARDRLAGILRASPRGSYRAALARADAVLAADFVDDLDRARESVAALGGKGGRDGALARAYLGLATGDVAAARAAAEEAGARDDAAVALVLARAALLDGRAAEAAPLAATAVAGARRPASLLALCDAERARKRWPDATKACADVDTLVPGHPGAVIGRARIAAASGASRADSAGLLAGLEALVAEAARPEAEQKIGVSRGQEAWAQVAMAEIAIAAGDNARARRALERLEVLKLDRRELREARAALRLAVGDVEQARELATAGLATWSTSVAFAVVRARAALAAHQLDEAARVLDKVEGAAVNASVDALVTRGEIALARGVLDDARKDLDAALAAAPDFEDAVLARARLDLAQAEPKAALTRLESRSGADAPPRVAVVYAAAQRALGQLDLARRALAPVLDDPPGPVTGLAYLESARIAREAGDVPAARTAYGKAGEMLASSEVRIEAALLAIDAGDAGGGRDTLVPLAAEPGADGALLVEAGRAQLLCGKLDEAKALLDRAEQAATRPEARLERERGRLALRRRDNGAAIAALERSVTLDPADLDAQLLLMDAYLVGQNAAGAQRVDNELKRSFPQRPERLLAGGRTALQAEQYAEAREAFETARRGLARAPRRLQADALYWLGLAQLMGGDAGPAKASLTEATRLDPFHADAHAVLGQTLRALGDAGGAIAVLRRAQELDPDNVDLDAELGELLVGRDGKEARRLLERYLTRAPRGDRAEAVREQLGRLRP